MQSEQRSIKLFVFLGNYGREFESNRHNVAWQFLKTLPFSGKLTWQRKFKGRFADFESLSGKVWFLMPETYMNLSGESVIELMKFFRIGIDEILIVHDELEMPFGSFGFKVGGGLGGHNGLRSLEKCLGSREFARMRFGIGRPDHNDIAGYVLSDFTKDERFFLDSRVFPKASEAFFACMNEGLADLPETHKKVILPKI
jgi:PTH1 family peptidyl-tRNA hydrolase